MQLRQFAALSIVFLLAAIPYLSFPIDDDTGVYLMMAKGILGGKHIYSDLLDNKGPLLYFALVPAVLFAGTSVIKLRLLGFGILILHGFLIYIVMRRMGEDRIALLAVAAFYFLSLNPMLEAYELKGEMFMGLLLTVVLYLLLAKDRGETNALIIGLCLACGALMKPTFMIFLLPVLLSVPKTKKTFAGLGLGLVLGMLLLAMMIATGFFSFGDYLQNTILQPIDFAGRLATTLDAPMPVLVIATMTIFPYMWVFLLAGSYVAVGFGAMGQGMRIASSLFTTMLVIIIAGIWSIGGIYPAILALCIPLSSILIAAIVRELTREVPKNFMFAAFASITFLAFTLGTLYCLATAAIYGPVPKINCEETDLTIQEQNDWADFIVNNTASDEKILAYPLSTAYYFSSREPITPALWFEPIKDNISYYDGKELESLLFGKIASERPRYIFIDPNGMTSERQDNEIRRHMLEGYNFNGTIGRVHVYIRE